MPEWVGRGLRNTLSAPVQGVRKPWGVWLCGGPETQVHTAKHVSFGPLALVDTPAKPAFFRAHDTSLSIPGHGWRHKGVSLGQLRVDGRELAGNSQLGLLGSTGNLGSDTLVSADRALGIVLEGTEPRSQAASVKQPPWEEYSRDPTPTPGLWRQILVPLFIS